MKSYLFLYARPEHPPLYCLIRARRAVNVCEDRFVWLSSLSHKFSRLRCYVEVFLTACFLLTEDDAGKA